ncbi:hypothetical protein OPV22_031639 [Ensete ventricosum]|uniref:Uncharacterized protein n=1 Tax=Ensete ventricosum TaxID=4639 RepID=A0AAV8PPN4_ENSVE|nr:hypothetical protein OPV22_031639 [Ensete ventricosum]
MRSDTTLDSDISRSLDLPRLDGKEEKKRATNRKNRVGYRVSDPKFQGFWIEIVNLVRSYRIQIRSIRSLLMLIDNRVELDKPTLCLPRTPLVGDPRIGSKRMQRAMLFVVPVFPHSQQGQTSLHELPAVPKDMHCIRSDLKGSTFLTPATKNFDRKVNALQPLLDTACSPQNHCSSIDIVR